MLAHGGSVTPKRSARHRPYGRSSELLCFTGTRTVRLMRKFLYTALLLGAIAAHPGWGQSGVSNFDVRDSAPLPEQAKAMVGWRSGLRIVPNRYRLPKTLFREGRALSAPSDQDRRGSGWLAAGGQGCLKRRGVPDFQSDA